MAGGQARRHAGSGRRRLAAGLGLALGVLLLVPAARAGAAATAPGGPGAPSYFDLGRKDCVGTATGTASRV